MDDLDALDYFLEINGRGYNTQYDVWDDKGNWVFTTWDRAEAYRAAECYLKLWQERHPSESIRALSGGAFEMNRRKH